MMDKPTYRDWRKGKYALLRGTPLNGSQMAEADLPHFLVSAHRRDRGRSIWKLEWSYSPTADEWHLHRVTYQQ